VISRVLPPPPLGGAHSLSPRALAVTGWVALALAIAAFATLAWNVSARTSVVLLDARVTEWFVTHRTAAATAVMLAITQAHSLLAIATGSVVFAAALARLREWYWMLTLALAVGGGVGLNALLKLAFERARPHMEDPLLILDSYSFPSGHAAAATVFYGVLAAFLVSRTWRHDLRALAVAMAILATSLVALSRVYLGVHYVSDVVAAMCSSTAWLVLCLSAVHRLVRRRMAET
jgi:membrane-associated phospholipid phosphatase